MSVYPFQLDDDTTIFRVDDNVTEIAGQNFNQVRDAVFKIEGELGVNPSGTLTSIKEFLDVSFNENGTIKNAALTAVGLVTLPIDNAQVGINAGILESKLALDFSTATLNALILSNSALINTISTTTASTLARLNSHIAGGPAANLRHVASQIDLNAVTSDTRDLTYIWTGLLNKAGIQRSATQVAAALLEINNDLVDHLNATADAHPATAITVDTSNFGELPQTADTVQKALDAIDDIEELTIGLHRAVMHDNAVPRTARSELINGPDGYSSNVVPPTPIKAFLIASPATSPQDNNNTGDDIVKFFPVDNSNFVFDSQFTGVRPGDIMRINYGNGVAGRYIVESSRFLPGTEWVVRLNGTNLAQADDGYDGYDGYARIDRPLFDTDTFGVFACAAANNDIDPTIPGSIVVGSPRGATAFGINFDANKIDTTHYNLYLKLYPTGNPADAAETLPAIDVTGNAGITPGKYTIESIVQETNNALRAAGYNNRFVAFNHLGNFGIMLSDSIGTAAFSIISGIISGATIAIGSFTNNVIGDAVDGLDGLGLGSTGINLASPDYNATFADATAASSVPTVLINPLKSRNAIINGQRRDTFADGYMTSGDGYWLATISARDVIGVTTTEVEYEIDLNLAPAGIMPGMTITVQPVVDITGGSYLQQDYGRFIVKSTNFDCVCPGDIAKTIIRVVNGVHATGNPISAGSGVGLVVKIYFGEDSVGFNANNIIDALPTGLDYNRYHEIFITDEGKTFSHERMRMPKQSAAGALLDTNSNWTIKDVSPKLRGFADAGSTDFRRYLRFYVLSYDTASGEYDGYIGRREVGGDGIFNFGAVSIGRKNVPTRFYDSSNIDFIEIEFTESGTNAIIQSAPSRYVDMEVFPTLRLDDELFLLGSCEVDGVAVECVRDRREFGGVSEKNFSLSALDFIQAGERFLHANGVVKGFDYLGVLPADTATLQFSGGIVLVNGAFHAVDDNIVRIPEIYPDGSSLPQSLDWVICINSSGNLEAVALTAIKDQFNVTTGGPAYYVESVTFAELVAVRKDLTPIAVASVTINSVTVDSVADARRFVRDESLNIPFSWTPGLINERVSTELAQQISGSFQTFEAVQTWINKYGSIDNTVIIKGMIDLTASLDLTNLTQPVVFQGNGSSSGFRIREVAQGVIVGSNQTFKNLYVSYDPPTGSYTNRLNNGNGAFYRNVSEQVVSNILIENCTFEVGEFGGHPPHINFEVSNIGVLDRLTIRDCNFIDYAISTQVDAAAIAIVGESGGSGKASNVLIENNRCNLNQGIYLVTAGTAVPGLSAYNCIIRGNQAGIIGYSIGSSESDVSLNFSGANDAEGVWKPSGLTISQNNAVIVASCNEEGTLPSSIAYSTGHVSISENRLNWISAMNVDWIEALKASTLKIRGNTLTASSGSLFTDLTSGIAISVIIGGGLSSATEQNVEVSGNSIDFGIVPGTDTSYNYTHGIVCQTPSLVTGNIIRGLADDSGSTIGISVAAHAGVTTVTNNQIYRGSNSIAYYVYFFNFLGLGSAKIVDNLFDSPTTDGSSTDTIFSSGPNITAHSNINQSVTVTFGPASKGTWGVGDISATNTTIAGAEQTITTNRVVESSDVGARDSANVEFNSFGIGAIATFGYSVALNEIIPEGARIISLDIDFTTLTTVAGNQWDYNVRLIDRAGAVPTNSTGLVALPAAASIVNVPLTITSLWKSVSNQFFNFELSIGDAAAIKSVKIGTITILVRY